MMKTCNQCGITKPEDDFYRDVAMPSGRAKQCKNCKNKKTEKWRHDNREKYNADMRAYNKENYSRLRLYRYKLSEAKYNQMLLDQKNLCAICLKPPPKGRPLNIDHDHNTGKTRGLLCHGCNRLMVLLDNPDLLSFAQAYLAKYL